ncbi:MAG: cell division/cell wall cluster transcriptional repressor MraZ [Bacteroidales bacterium]|nr:cell division/cell wall cluster transcriptional repressor MraZ [Bacteroidales bacterium]
MSSFIGDFDAKMDIKQRVVLPAAFKRSLEEMGEVRLVAQKDIYENCLRLVPYKTWEEDMAALRAKLNLYNRQHMQLLRAYQANTAEMQLDSNGRVLIPKKLTDLAHIDRDVKFLGVDRYVEIWSTEIYDQQSDANAEVLAQLAQEILA